MLEFTGQMIERWDWLPPARQCCDGLMIDINTPSFITASGRCQPSEVLLVLAYFLLELESRESHSVGSRLTARLLEKLAKNPSSGLSATFSPLPGEKGHRRSCRKHDEKSFNALSYPGSLTKSHKGTGPGRDFRSWPIVTPANAASVAA